MTTANPPEYRIRLFLSADLVGSTAYKSTAGLSNLVWIKAFQKFYGEFPSLYDKNYRDVCLGLPEIGQSETDDGPKVWKTIGDEILFVNRVTSITQLGAYVSAFEQSLAEFGREIEDAFDQLNVKGNGWIAAFPTPNRSITLEAGEYDSLVGRGDILSEDFEIEVDKQPNRFDFLGKGIDGGFRIARNSTVDAFTVSPALAYLLCRAKRNVDTTQFRSEFRFHGLQEFKGVLNGVSYPVISINTSRDAEHSEIKSLEAELLNQPNLADFVKLGEYLAKYLEYHEIEQPVLKLTMNSTEILPPQHYQEYIEEWKKDFSGITEAIKYEQQAAEEDGATGEHAPLDEAAEVTENFIKLFASKLRDVQMLSSAKAAPPVDDEFNKDRTSNDEPGDN